MRISDWSSDVCSSDLVECDPIHFAAYIETERSSYASRARLSTGNKMKFIFADSLDYVDPAFDFVADRSPAGRQPYWDDCFPHEIMGYAPYDGVLVSRGIVGDHRVKGKYTSSQARRFSLVGARKFLRLDKQDFAHLELFADCGAFTNAPEVRPPNSH